VMTEHDPVPEPSLDQVLAADAWARRRVLEESYRQCHLSH
jgi:hypothetical protein